MNEHEKLHATAAELVLPDCPISKDQSPKRRKGPRGPNPLSVKKKKPANASMSMKHNNESIALVSAGSKRKAENSEEESCVEDGDLKHQMGEVNPKKKRRKRTRKTTDGKAGCDSESLVSMSVAMS